MREFKKPDVKASRYRPEFCTILKKEFFDNFSRIFASNAKSVVYTNWLILAKCKNNANEKEEMHVGEGIRNV